MPPRPQRSRHDPLRPHAELYVRDTTGTLVRLNLALEGLTEAQEVSLPGGTLQLFRSATVDPAKPLAQLAASVAVPAGIKRAIAFIFPAGGEAVPPYRMMVIDDGLAAFPKAETRVLNLTKLELAMKAGEHSVKLPPSALTAVPKVTKLNDLNQAQTEFYKANPTPLEVQLGAPSKTPGDPAFLGLTALCHALLSSNALLYVD